MDCSCTSVSHRNDINIIALSRSELSLNTVIVYCDIFNPNFTEDCNLLLGLTWIIALYTVPPKYL
jgi:hypothetical protein